jgi:hypothetical protein
MKALDEAGEDDLCALLNEVQGSQSYFGTGRDLVEYVAAIAALQQKGKLIVRKKSEKEGMSDLGETIEIATDEHSGAFKFDESERMWRWHAPERRHVEIVV